MTTWNDDITRLHFTAIFERPLIWKSSSPEVTVPYAGRLNVVSLWAQFSGNVSGGKYVLLFSFLFFFKGPSHCGGSTFGSTAELSSRDKYIVWQFFASRTFSRLLAVRGFCRLRGVGKFERLNIRPRSFDVVETSSGPTAAQEAPAASVTRRRAPPTSAASLLNSGSA